MGGVPESQKKTERCWKGDVQKRGKQNSGGARGAGQTAGGRGGSGWGRRKHRGKKNCWGEKKGKPGIVNAGQTQRRRTKKKNKNVRKTGSKSGENPKQTKPGKSRGDRGGGGGDGTKKQKKTYDQRMVGGAQNTIPKKHRVPAVIRGGGARV